MDFTFVQIHTCGQVLAQGWHKKLKLQKIFQKKLSETA